MSRDPALRTDRQPAALGWARTVEGTWGRAERRLLGGAWGAAVAFEMLSHAGAAPCQPPSRVPLCCGCLGPRAWAARAPSWESRGCGTGSRLLVVLGRLLCGTGIRDRDSWELGSSPGHTAQVCKGTADAWPRCPARAAPRAVPSRSSFLLPPAQNPASNSSSGDSSTVLFLSRAARVCVYM